MSQDDVRSDQRPGRLMTNPDRLRGMQQRIPEDIFTEETLKPQARQEIIKNRGSLTRPRLSPGASSAQQERLINEHERTEQAVNEVAANNTLPVYSTLPANSGRFNKTQVYDAGAAPPP